MPNLIKNLGRYLDRISGAYLTFVSEEKPLTPAKMLLCSPESETPADSTKPPIARGPKGP